MLVTAGQAAKLLVQASSEFQKPRAPGHEFGIKNNFSPHEHTGGKEVSVEFPWCFLI